MNSNWRILRLTAAAVAVLFSTAVAFAQGHEHGQMQSQTQGRTQTLKVGKRGEITLSQPTKVGDKVLQPDTYVVQHRVSGSDHFVRFVVLKDVNDWNGAEGPITYTEEQKVGEIPCRIEPAANPIKKTTVFTVTEGGTLRITKIVIKGENVEHLF